MRDKFFRVRHLQGRRVFSGWIAQADITTPSLPLLSEVRDLHCKEQGDFYEFPESVAVGDRAIAVKRLDDSLSTWILAIDVLDFAVGENPNVYQEFAAAAAALSGKLSDRGLIEIAAAIVAHEAAVNPHPEYFSSVAGVGLVQALAAKADLTVITAALATKANALTLTAQTNNASLTEMNTPQRVLIRANSSVGYEISLVGHSTAATPEFIYWLGSGAIYRGASPLSTVLVTQTGTRRSSLGNGTNWTPTLSADTVNGALKIQVKGDGGKLIKWLASVRLTEVY
ncbi:MAG: hypothetical protein HC781_22770 [Leptolyngbyaceae cyanobacterium CSU_1_4]|nr:hypothetical protein [Leptolyngbyaceae cyanobacterium CSU_1_4]